MFKFTLHTVLLVMLAGLAFPAMAQQGVYIPKKGKVYFSADTSTIFSNVINQGNFGVGKKAVVNFKGKTWENDAEGKITDETDGGTGTRGAGGLIRFIGEGMRQQIIGGYNAVTKTGASFYNLQIHNSEGVELFSSNAKVRNEINFSRGLFYLRDNILSVGDNHPGIISGFNESRYFVTSNRAGNGALMRENIRRVDGLVTFPVGSKAGSYTPAGIRSRTAAGDDYYVNVFDSTKAALVSGSNLAAESVNKTWEVGKRLHPNEGEVELSLQHQNKDEGAFFAANRNYSYIAQFAGGTWDEIYPQGNPGAGSLTTGNVQPNSGLNKRELRALSNPSYFTKLSAKGRAVKTKLWFNAYRLDRDRVRVLWKTHPEVNVQSFIVQRRLASETRFKNIATVGSQIGGGVSLSPVDYSIIDNNNYTGVSFYRLLMLHNKKDSTYSNIVAVGSRFGPNDVILWPNPTPDRFFVALNTAVPVKAIVIYNVLGQKMREYNVEGQTIAEIKGHRLIPGTYFVSLIGVPGTVLATKKLVIAIYD